MILPNFMIIGAGKSGTTSVYQYLKQHPAIYVSPIKETNFFAIDDFKASVSGPWPPEADRFPIRTLEQYGALFGYVTNETAIGEASIRYLGSPRAPGRIKDTLPDVKLIAILRDPVERAYSSYFHQVRDAVETRSLRQAIDDEIKGTVDGSTTLTYAQRRYMRLGFYHQHLSRYFELFDRRRISVFLFEDLKEEPDKLLREMFDFLEVDPSFKPDVSVRYNVSGSPKNEILFNLTKKRPLTTAVKRWLPGWVRDPIAGRFEKLRGGQLTKPPIDPSLRGLLIEEYRQDLLRLQDLIGRDLSHWLR
jgi:hypothetical protein